jgi:hypothetical protein
MRSVALDGDQPPVCGQRARKPDRAVAAQRPDLEDPSCAARGRQHHEQLALERRHADCRQPGRVARGERGGEHRIALDEYSGEISIDGRPSFVTGW